ncbi:MAG: hypothetical protein WBM01_23655 [Mycobacterium sp.]|uniref:hypothetical protein n=1 Tax=Mycobacterium sp. TaxID=1785 RepID=UPI003C76E500
MAEELLDREVEGAGIGVHLASRGIVSHHPTQGRTYIWQMRKSNRLLWAVLGTVVVGLVILGGLAFAAWHFRWEGFWRGAGQPYATALAALAAITAAAIALHNNRSQLDELRAQRDQDQARWEDQRRRDDITDLRDRFSQATEQLADERPTVRRSGAYAMASLAGDWGDVGDQDEVKICMSVLAAYVNAPNPTYEELNVAGDPEAGEDGPIRALIVSLLSKYAGKQFQDLWGKLHVASLRRPSKRALHCPHQQRPSFPRISELR